jgi:hypothetical protein
MLDPDPDSMNPDPNTTNFFQFLVTEWPLPGSGCRFSLHARPDHRQEMYRKTFMGPEIKLWNGIFSRGFTRVFVCFFNLVFLLYKMLFMNRLNFLILQIFLQQFSNQRRVWFSLTSTSRRDRDRHGSKNN